MQDNPGLCDFRFLPIFCTFWLSSGYSLRRNSVWIHKGSAAPLFLKHLYVRSRLNINKEGPLDSRLHDIASYLANTCHEHTGLQQSVEFEYGGDIELGCSESNIKIGYPKNLGLQDYDIQSRTLGEIRLECSNQVCYTKL